VYIQRDRRGSSVFDAFRSAQQSRTVSRALIEASSWESCRSFLIGYCRQLKHYRDGNATDREDALEAYDDALRAQTGFPTAAYNRATLLYNRYLPQANDESIAGFEVATASEDPSLRPLAYAGLAMAHCQAIHRFHRPASEHEEPARRAAETAFELAPELEEASFARGWLFQIDSHWTEAIEHYEKVAELPGDSAAARRIKSFALNNAAWILLYEHDTDPRSSEHAEALLWRAVALYPNKIAYANLAEIARRNDRREVAVQLFGVALSLDPAYTNGLNELAVVEAELAARSRSADEAASWREAAQRHAAKAQRLAERDPAFAALLAEQFRNAAKPVSRQEVRRDHATKPST
jgi:tetratricopeptide (TPR) repeat protein